MRLKQPFYKLPLRFDAERMLQEVSQAPESAWREHPSGYEGNSALILVSARGGENDDMRGPMQPTQKLDYCPYLKQVMAAFRTVVGRCRLMRLEPGANVTSHCDISYYWRKRIRLHIPIVTDPRVAFTSKDETVHMAAGEAWTFDNWYMHGVKNPTDIQRIHMVIDTVGTSSLWRMIHGSAKRRVEPRFIPYRPDETPNLTFENHPGIPVMAPGELEAALAALAGDTRQHEGNDPEQLAAFLKLTQDLGHEWHSQWMMHGPDSSGWPGYRSLVRQALESLDRIGENLLVASNRLSAASVLRADLQAAFTPSDRQAAAVSRRRKRIVPEFRKPVFIVAAPRSGSTLLFETLAENRAFLSTGDENHMQFESIPELQPQQRGYDSNRLLEDDASPGVIKLLKANFTDSLKTADGVPFQPRKGKSPGIRFLEKTPKNALRIPFLHAAFPDARFIYLYRNPRDNISSLLDSWRSGRYVTYRDLPDWDGPDWSHLLIPGWEKLIGASLAEIVKQQWLVTNQTILDDLEALPDEQWTLVSYDDLLSAPAREIERLCTFANVPFGARMQDVVGNPLKNSKYTLTRPDPDKWRKNEDELKPVLEQVEPMIQRVMALHSEH